MLRNLRSISNKQLEQRRKSVANESDSSTFFDEDRLPHRSLEAYLIRKIRRIENEIMERIREENLEEEMQISQALQNEELQKKIKLNSK